MIGWTFFSFESLSGALAYLKVMFKIGDYPLWDEVARDELSTDGWLVILLFLGSTLGGNHALVKIQTTAIQNRKLLLIKGSYANAFVPFLVFT